MTETSLIKKPWVTEKATGLQKIGQYIFLVQPSAVKSEIKKAIKGLYGVDAVSVRIINRAGKKKRLGRRFGHQPSYKKAIITLKSGQTIDLGQ